MQFNITFILKGAARTIEAPNTSNPVECENLASLLKQLADNLPEYNGLNIETVGIRIEQC